MSVIALSLHIRPKLLKNLRAPIQGARRRPLSNNNNSVFQTNYIEAHRAHIQQHPRNVQQWREQKHASALKNDRNEQNHNFLHNALLGASAAGVLVPAVAAAWGGRRRAGGSGIAEPAVAVHWRRELGF